MLQSVKLTDVADADVAPPFAKATGGRQWFRLATLAQRLEQHFCKVKVVGSNPTGGSTLRQFSWFREKEQPEQMYSICPAR